MIELMPEHIASLYYFSTNKKLLPFETLYNYTRYLQYKFPTYAFNITEKSLKQMKIQYSEFFSIDNLGITTKVDRSELKNNILRYVPYDFLVDGLNVTRNYVSSKKSAEQLI